MPILIFIIICISLFLGWRLSDYHLITPEHGIGYILGIVGASGVLFLLLYSLRKWVKAFKFMGNTRRWFQLHMFMGSFSPVIIIFHSNFSLGSLNSRIALFSMLIVASSGIVGRYFYRKIHSNLTGTHKNFKKLRNELEEEQEELLEIIPTVQVELSNFAEDMVNQPSKIIRSFFHYISVEKKSSKLLKYVRKEIKEAGLDKELRKKLIKRSKRFVRHASRIAELAFFERLFSIWHILHIPLFFIMVFAVIVHIIAVHMY